MEHRYKGSAAPSHFRFIIPFRGAAGRGAKKRGSLAQARASCSRFNHSQAKGNQWGAAAGDHRAHARRNFAAAKGQEFQAIVENTPDQIIRYDREFRPTYINPAAAGAGGLLTDTL